MKQKILVAYASAFGSTAEVAAEIGKTLGKRGFQVEVRPVHEQPDLEGCAGVVIGSAVQYGKWLPEAVAFVQANQAVLQSLPVGLFCVHIANQGDDPQSRQSRLGYFAEVRPLLQAVSETWFAGKFDRRGAALLLPRMLARLVPTMDHRNWQAINAWAESLPLVLLVR